MSETTSPAVAHDGSSFIVIDIGKRQKSKEIRKLRKGSGKLVVEYATLDQLDNLIAALSGRQ